MKFPVGAFYKHFHEFVADQFLNYGHGVHVLAGDMLTSNPDGPRISTVCTHNAFLPADSLPDNFLLRHPNASVALTLMDDDADCCRVQIVWVSTPERNLEWVWARSVTFVPRRRTRPSLSLNERHLQESNARGATTAAETVGAVLLPARPSTSIKSAAEVIEIVDLVSSSNKSAISVCSLSSGTTETSNANSDKSCIMILSLPLCPPRSVTRSKRLKLQSRGDCPVTRSMSARFTPVTPKSDDVSVLTDDPPDPSFWLEHDSSGSSGRFDSSADPRGNVP